MTNDAKTILRDLIKGLEAITEELAGPPKCVAELLAACRTCLEKDRRIAAVEARRQDDALRVHSARGKAQIERELHDALVGAGEIDPDRMASFKRADEAAHSVRFVG